MALTKILACIALTFLVQAIATPSDHDWVFQHMKMPNHKFRSLPSLPSYPDIPSFSDLPVLPPFYPFALLDIHVPSPADIANRQPDPDQDFSGAALRSKYVNQNDNKGENGDTGGTVFVSNSNGDVEEIRTGESPPNIDDPFVFPSIIMPEMPSFKTFKFEPIKFEPIVFKPIKQLDADELKNYKPKEGENYVAFSQNSFANSETVNGVTKSSGGGEKMVNLNGAVDKEKVVFGQKDKPKRKGKNEDREEDE